MTDLSRDTRRPFGGMTPEEIDVIAERAAKKVLEHMYAEVGKTVLRRLLWLIGIVVVSLALWLAGKDALRMP